ncbi:hypothetical protein [Arthrobacter sp. UM1]|uniref:hypothetical protein n=1 Tax=Arthrobacter sp. UM1 TaxID=2766776 RepID=UPI001CF6B132|nr:hypothetical protein [Arthrobacter sp. UM1]MCB4208769.1 hypothetical protein [Arthrobacter sp. UM1]
MTSPAASRPYSVLRLYLPAEHFSGATSPETIAAGLDHEALEATAMNRELPEILMSASERRQQRLSRTPVYRALFANERVYVTPEQPEARLPETARALYQSLGEQMFARIVSPEDLEEAHDAFDDRQLDAELSGVSGRLAPADPAASRYMWAASACVPISWLVLWAEEDAKPVPAAGIIRVDVDTALARLRRAILTLSWAALPTDIVDELGRTEAWLTPHADGIVELDYGAASRILGSDDSPRDLGIALAALEDQDTVTATAAYRRFERRWRDVHNAIARDLTSGL